MKIKLTMQEAFLEVDVQEDKAMSVFRRLAEKLFLYAGEKEPEVKPEETNLGKLMQQLKATRREIQQESERQEAKWQQLRPLVTITKDVWERLYGALHKLKDYEDTGLSPEEVVSLDDFEKTQAYKLLEKLSEERDKHRFIPITEKLPDPDENVLLSFENASFVMIGRYTVDDEDSGTFRLGDDDESFIENDMYVNAWMKLPAPYREEEDPE